MSGYRIGDRALEQLGEIYRHTLEHWGLEAAEAYSRSLFQVFQRIADNDIVSRTIEKDVDVDGKYVRCASHLVYWRSGRDDRAQIVAILHGRMHQPHRVRQAFSDDT